MKYYKRKQICRFTLFGKDDVNFNDTSSITNNGTTFTKKMIFNIQGLPNLELSNNSKLVLESAFLKNKVITNNEDSYNGNILIRCNNINNNGMWDSDGKRMKSVLIWSGAHTNDQLWNNTSPELFYNYEVARNFLQNTQLHFEIIFESEFNNTTAANQLLTFNDFSLSFILYDYDVEDIHTMSEIDFKRMFMGRETNHSLGH